MFMILSAAQANEVGLELWVPSIISVITLILNGWFYIFVQPKLTEQAKAKESLTEISLEFLKYLADIVSYDDFEGVPTKVREYSLQIHLHFKHGIANKKLEKLLEQIFQDVQERKTLEKEPEIEEWTIEFRKQVKELRKQLAKKCGVF